MSALQTYRTLSENGPEHIWWSGAKMYSLWHYFKKATMPKPQDVSNNEQSQ